jgi:hypothetical protein
LDGGYFLFTNGQFVRIALPCGSLASGINEKKKIVGDCDAGGFSLKGRQLR